MAPRKKTLTGTWRGPKAEKYTVITWHRGNRARHEAEYPDRPGFTAAELADWSLVYKRVDVEHSKPGKNSFQALVGRRVVGADLVTHMAVISWHTPRAMASSKSSASGSRTPRSARSSSARPLIRRAPTKPAARQGAPAEEVPEPTLDRDALEALACIEAGMPEGQVGYGPDAPKLAPEQLEQFERASYAHTPDAKAVRRRAARK